MSARPEREKILATQADPDFASDSCSCCSQGKCLKDPPVSKGQPIQRVCLVGHRAIRRRLSARAPQGIDKKPDLPMRFLCTRAKARATRALDVDAARSALRSEADMRGTLGHVRLGRIRGRVAGTAEAAAAVAEAAPKKSVMACVNTLAASAACWIA